MRHGYINHCYSYLIMNIKCLFYNDFNLGCKEEVDDEDYDR
jgi:hypothetical protein